MDNHRAKQSFLIGAAQHTACKAAAKSALRLIGPALFYQEQ
jgi:hypothetical protein